MQIFPTFQQISPTILWLRQQPDKPGDAAVPAQSSDPATAQDDTVPKLVCAQCGHSITTDAWRIPVAGSHQHVFANPYGQVFSIACFAAAPGCATVGPLSQDFSWFPGTGWQVAICASCGLHLGWRYERDSGDGSFFGLIPDRLQRVSDNLA